MYPISYDADAVLDGRNRLTTLFRGIVVIPWQIVQYFYGIAAQIAAFIAWFAIVFTGRYPQGIYNFNAGFLRMSTRVNSFYYLLNDESASSSPGSRFCSPAGSRRGCSPRCARRWLTSLARPATSSC